MSGLYILAEYCFDASSHSTRSVDAELISYCQYDEALYLKSFGLNLKAVFQALRD